ncbi:unnamed protein product [Choristocarpus tenellus]
MCIYIYIHMYDAGVILHLTLAILAVQCFYPHQQTDPPSLRGLRLCPLKCRVINLQHDSALEYAQLRPSPLPSLGLGAGQEAELSALYGGVPPPHVRGMEALFDRTMETLDGLVSELRSVENRVARLQLEKQCLREVWTPSAGSHVVHK